MAVRAADRLQRVRGRRLRHPQGNQADQEPGSAARPRDGAGRVRSVARHGGDRRPEDAGRVQPLNNALYSYSLPDLKPIGTAFLGGKGAAWVTLTPDGRK